ncbi:MAG: exonuclease subunit SbcD [Myxococcota bacterium]
MRILHTSDWHLGRTLHGHSRAAEHEAFLDELVDVATDVDLVLISGDVFETTNPPIEAEELLFDALARLGDGGRRAVVVIAGNHDSPDRLKAPGPLTASHAVWILGRPGDVPRPRRPSEPGVRLAEGRPSVLVLDLPCGERAVVAAVPYPSEARLRQMLSPVLDERSVQAAYEQRIAGLFAELSASFRPEAVNLATSHLAVSSCMPSSSERALIGGAWQVAGSVLPAGAQYTALGHLHLAQQVPDAPSLARYAGAPLAMRFSERDFPRNHVLIDVAPGGAPAVELVPISAGRPLVEWTVQSLEEVERGVADGLHPNAFVDLRLRVDARLTHAEVARIKRLPRDFVRIRTILPESVVTPLLDPARRRELPLNDLFTAFYRDQTGHEPEAELTTLLLELASNPEPGDERAVG